VFARGHCVHSLNHYSDYSGKRWSIDSSDKISWEHRRGKMGGKMSGKIRGGVG
jgi:hypothetical protein